ncbi:hypothetical protein ACFQJ7_14550 [Halovenus rubra]|uniref:Uncharacterized protein n=2 Tax=Halovenus rubra TaxID=869890 RepID=A0ACC7DYM8_9EURY|nr:hypothetical protein [Halovenus rubra]
MSTNNLSEQSDLIADLDRLEERIEEAEEHVAEFGEEDLQELADVYGQFTDVLDRFEEDVTDDGGDIETNIEFQSAIAEVVEDVSDDLLLSETFEECDESLQKRWFHESDFEEVRELLEPVGDLVSRLERRDELISEYQEKREDIRYRIRDLDEQIIELDRLARLSDADLEAPTERLRGPIERYNDAVTDAFDSFIRESSSREVIDFLVAMTEYPLVSFVEPDEELASYVREYPLGQESVSTLLEYADYSNSKLSHYVDDPEKFTHAVGRKQTYLDGIDGEALTVSWPAPPADELEYRCRELTAAVNRFAPAVVEQLRHVEALPRETEYGRLRDAAVVRETLSDEERDRIQNADIAAELSEARDQREALETALEAYPKL